ncbi:MAG: diacylglycerol/lipid kinase family protein [Acidobacteriota bacterium]
MKIIANPRSGHGRGVGYIRKLAKLLTQKKIDYELWQTREPGHGTSLARRLVENGCRRLVVMGGDGTLSEVLNGAMGSSVELGFVSTGTGNDLARSLGLPFNDVRSSLQVLLSGRPRSIDVGWEKDRYFVSALGIGFPALVADETNRFQWLGGSVAFFLAVYKALYRMKPTRVRIGLDDQVLELNCTSVLIQNTPYTGGGLLVAPGAKWDDGLFDVVVVNAISKIDLMWNFPRVYRGRHLDHPHFSVYQSRRVTVDSTNRLRKAFDGDTYGCVPVRTEVLHRALNIILPVV